MPRPVETLGRLYIAGTLPPVSMISKSDKNIGGIVFVLFPPYWVIDNEFADFLQGFYTVHYGNALSPPTDSPTRGTSSKNSDYKTNRPDTEQSPGGRQVISD